MLGTPAAIGLFRRYWNYANNLEKNQSQSFEITVFGDQR